MLLKEAVARLVDDASFYQVLFTCDTNGCANISDSNSKYIYNQFKLILSAKSENTEEVLRDLIIELARPSLSLNVRQQFFALLSSIVANKELPSTTICIALLKNSAILECENMFVQTVNFVMNFCSREGYKACRDIFQQFLALLKNFSNAQPDSLTTKAALQLLNKLLDKETCWLPSYLSFDLLFIQFSFLVDKSAAANPAWPFYNIINDFMHSFSPIASMMSVRRRNDLTPIMDSNLFFNDSGWRLDQGLKFAVTGKLPYPQEYNPRRSDIISSLIIQPFAFDAISYVLSANTPKKCANLGLEETFVDVIISLMEEEESDQSSARKWNAVASNLVYLSQNGPGIVRHAVVFELLRQKLSNQKRMKRGRERLMWLALQVFPHILSSPLQLSDVTILMSLYNLLYAPNENALLPPENLPLDADVELACACLMIHMRHKINKSLTEEESKGRNIEYPLPKALSLQVDYLTRSFCDLKTSKPMNEPRLVAILCNAYSTSQDDASVPFITLLESVRGQSAPIINLTGNCTVHGALNPLDMTIINSLSACSRQTLMKHIFRTMKKHAKPDPLQNIHYFAPAFVETLARLMTTPELQMVAIKDILLSLKSIYDQKTYGFFIVLLEIIVYRFNCISANYRCQLLGHFYTIERSYHSNTNPQLFTAMENAWIHILLFLNHYDYFTVITRVENVQHLAAIVSYEIEELNKIYILQLAKSMIILGSEVFKNSLSDLVQIIQNQTPHSFPSHTLQYFPRPLCALYDGIKQQEPLEGNHLRQIVEEECKWWRQAVSEQDIVQHFTHGQNKSNVVICVIYKMHFSQCHLSQVTAKLLEKIGPRHMGAHIRVFADFLMYEVISWGQQFSKCLESVEALIYTYGVIPLERLLLALLFRPNSGDLARGCYYLIQLLLMKSDHLNSRIKEFTSLTDPAEAISNYRARYPEHQHYEGVYEATGIPPTIPLQVLPSYMSCGPLRLLPILDLILSNFLEQQTSARLIDNLVERFGPLYRFHRQPLHFLFRLFTYYDNCPQLDPHKRHTFVGAIFRFCSVNKPTGWFLSEEMSNAVSSKESFLNWKPSVYYYKRLLHRLSETIRNPASFKPFCLLDFRIEEYTSAPTHCLYATCIELLLGAARSTLPSLLFEAAFEGDNPMGRVNAAALIVVTLPCETFVAAFFEHIKQLINSIGQRNESVEKVLAACMSDSTNGEINQCLIATHAVLQHATSPHFNVLSKFLLKLEPIVITEAQLVMYCFIVLPFLPRISNQRSRIATELYAMIGRVTTEKRNLYLENTFADLLYFFKYMFVGDEIKSQIESTVKGFPPNLQRKIKFLISTKPTE